MRALPSAAFSPFLPISRMTLEIRSPHGWKPPICIKGDSSTVFWMNSKRDIQRPRMLANVRRLPECREAYASHGWGNPVAKAAVMGDRKEPR